MRGPKSRALKSFDYSVLSLNTCDMLRNYKDLTDEHRTIYSSVSINSANYYLFSNVSFQKHKKKARARQMLNDFNMEISRIFSIQIHMGIWSGECNVLGGCGGWGIEKLSLT